MSDEMQFNSLEQPEQRRFVTETCEVDQKQ
jgi:hypothetical protein